MRTVCVDFDGVIHRYSKGWHDGSIYDEPMPGAIEGIKRLQERYAVVVHTSRDPGPVAAWLIDRDVLATWYTGNPDPDVNQHPEFWNDQTMVLVTNRKMPAFAYVDDRAVVFTSWTQMDAQLSGAESGNFGPACCPAHGRRCETGEFCCDFCTEAMHLHPRHQGLLCSAPDLSGNGS